jgi:hypothetical protein
MPKSSRHRIPRCGYRHGWFGNQGAKTECRHLATSVIEWYFCPPKIRRFDQGATSRAFKLRITANARFEDH